VKLALIAPGGFGAEGHQHAIPALSALADELTARHDVHVFAFAEPEDVGRYSLRGATIHRIEYPWLASDLGLLSRGLVFARAAEQLAREVLRAALPASFDVLHAFWANEPGLFAGLLGVAMRVPVVLSVGGGEVVRMPEIGYGGARTPLGRALGRTALLLADEVTVGTTFARSFLEDSTAQRARVIPLGIDWRRFDAPPARPVGPPWRLLHVANLNPIKDQSTLLTAFAKVVARLGDVSLDCVGEDALGGQVQTRAHALGLGARVRFHGFLSQDRLASMYRSAHLHVLSSRYESQGVVILEAAAAGLPTVGTAVGLLPTLSPEGACCVPTGDASALTGGICALLKDEGRRRAMGAAAQIFARAHDAVWTAHAFEAIYGRLAGRGRHRWDYGSPL
jgi:glycosyltransferase involved in cell wall biosynthesis